MPVETNDKLMFEIYREGTYNRDYRVVYYSELSEHNKDKEINRALNGDTFFDGYLAEATKKDAKAIIQGILDRLNDGEEVAPDEVGCALDAHLAV